MLEILTGIISGTVSGTGMGGGTILILILSVFMGIDQHVAQATNLIFFVPTSIAAIYINIKQKKLLHILNSCFFNIYNLLLIIALVAIAILITIIFSSFFIVHLFIISYMSILT